MKPTQLLSFMISIMTLSMTLPAQAASLFLYDSKEDFLTHTYATEISPFPTIETTEALRFTEYIHDDFRFTPTAPNTLFPGGDWTELLPGNELGMNGVEDLNIDLPNLIKAFGFDFLEPALNPNLNAQFIDSIFEVTLFNLDTAISSFQFAPPNDIASFVGVKSDTVFNRVEIREIVGGIDNEFYGTFYTGHWSHPNSKSVPEPSFILGLSLLITMGVFCKMNHQN